MATSAPGLQPSVASSSQTSSSDRKTSAEWKRYFDVLLERKKAADNGKGKGKPADWWQYLAVILQTDPERNWSLWGQLYRKNRSRLGLLRAEKLVFVSSAAKVKQKDLRSMEEKELELLCTSVNEDLLDQLLLTAFLFKIFHRKHYNMRTWCSRSTATQE
ncbi:TPA: hypothetical protein ACH3X1_011749 [Trebouxia sp. C0004]